MPATAAPVLDEDERRVVLSQVVAKWNREVQLDAFVEASPLVKVKLDEG